tara:strand:- start:1134 stop:1307 length:174 start_codon:yes stop_codon:yes gene_type:complete
MVKSVVPPEPPVLKTAAGDPLPAERTTKAFKRVRPPSNVPVAVAVFAVIEAAISASY